MLKLDCGNVLLKPSQRKQMMSWLRRALRLGERIGQFTLEITMHRVGKCYEVRMHAQDRAGVLTCRSKRHDWRDALREVVRRLTSWVHDQKLRPMLA